MKTTIVVTFEIEHSDSIAPTDIEDAIDELLRDGTLQAAISECGHSDLIPIDPGDLVVTSATCAAPDTAKDPYPQIQIHEGFTVHAYPSPRDGALVVELDGHPPGDEDCERVRVYMNDARAIEWVGIDDPRYIVIGGDV